MKLTIVLFLLLAGVLTLMPVVSPSFAAQRRIAPKASPVLSNPPPAGLVAPAAQQPPAQPSAPDFHLMDLEAAQSGAQCPGVEVTLENRGGSVPDQAYSASAPAGAVTFTVLINTAGGLHQVGSRMLIQVDPGRTLQSTPRGSPVTLVVPLDPGKTVPREKPTSFIVKLDPNTTPELNPTNNEVTKAIACPH